MQVIEELVLYAQKLEISGIRIDFAISNRKQVVETAVCYLSSVIAAHTAPNEELALKLLAHGDLWAAQGVTQADLKEAVKLLQRAREAVDKPVTPAPLMTLNGGQTKS